MMYFRIIYVQQVCNRPTHICRIWH